jgi:2-polyprenyl-6-methoxyphenol hydroxylase-like FAD-dependent oxidoreductase
VLRTAVNPASFDAIIVGTGVAAVACALPLLKLGRRVAMLERPYSVNVPAGETLSPRCSELLSRLGIWKDFLALSPLPSTSVRIAWNRACLQEQDYSFHPSGPWWHVDHASFRMLLLCAARHAGAHLIGVSDIEVERVNRREWTLELLTATGQPQRMDTSVLVDATGRSAYIARKCGARRKRYDNLMALTTVTHSEEQIAPSDIFTLIEATSDGWWYSSAVANRTFVATFMTDGPLPSGALERFWNDQLGRSRFTRSRLPGSGEQRNVFCLSAATLKTEPVSTQALFTVGDAAVTYDPLSSQGIQKALTSGYAAAIAIDDTLRGSDSAAEDYAHGIEADFERYLALKSRYYSTVTRFADREFWKRRSNVDITPVESASRHLAV